MHPRFTAGEYAELVEAAARAGLTPTGYVGKAALAAARGLDGDGHTHTGGITRAELAQLQRGLFAARTALNEAAAGLRQALTGADAGEVMASCARSVTALDAVVQMGGWSVTWQGASGETTTGGTTILAGTKQVAPAATVTYSKDASAPLEGSDVGVVVVGETPYAEGVGDVGVGGHDMKLSAPDKAAVDKVCAAMKCVVLVVSGRPLLISDQLDRMTALVASWSPGTEGTGVADVLFGARPFTGRLSMTWPKSIEQVPINVGDKTYEPLFPYGWGLRTDNAQDRLKTVRDQLAKVKHDRDVRAAVALIDRALAGGVWNGDGTVRNVPAVQLWIGLAVERLGHTGRDTYAQTDALVSVVRDTSQTAMVRAGGTAPALAARSTADADHALASGHADTAVGLLARAYWLVQPGR